jgi:CubicO group peptidase (beta-lactamase class C family)
VRRLLSHTAGLSVHGYVGQASDRPLPSIAASLAGETGDSFPVELLEAPGRRWLYSGGGYSLAQLLVEELTSRPFADYMQAEVLGPLGMTASSFRWSRTAHTARPHDADSRPVPDFAFAEQAAAGLVTTALHRPPMAAGALVMVLDCCQTATGSPTTRAPTAAGGPAWPCCPTVGRGSWCWPTATTATPRSTPWSSSGSGWPRQQAGIVDGDCFTVDTIWLRRL